MTEQHPKVAAAPSRLTLTALSGLPEVRAGDNLAELLAAACTRQDIELDGDDVLVVAQKIVSKSEDRSRRLADIEPGDEAVALAEQTGKDPRIVELILRESTSILRHVPDVLIVEHRQGFVMANAGIDQSNVDEGCVLLLPADIDASAETLRLGLRERLGVAPGIIISDSVGRAWRIGTVGLALGVAGMTALIDLRGEKDRFGRELRVSETAVADNLAAAASVLMGEAGEGRPAVVIRGYRGLSLEPQSGRHLLRDRERDLFR